MLSADPLLSNSNSSDSPGKFLAFKTSKEPPEGELLWKIQNNLTVKNLL